MQNTILTNLLTSPLRLTKSGDDRAAQASSAQEPDAPTPGASDAELAAAVKQINDFVQIVKRDLQFTIDKNSGRTIITVIDSETKEIVRQIPPEEVLSMAENLEQMRGGLLKAKA